MAKEYIIGQEYLDSQNQKKTAYFKDAEAVSTTEVQELTDTQKAQALANIGISGIDSEPTEGSKNLVKSGGVYDAIVSKGETLPTNDDGIFITDKELKVGMKYDENGFDAAKVSSHFVEVLKASGISHTFITNEDGFFITDEKLNIGVKVDSDGIHAKNILEYEIIEN